MSPEELSNEEEALWNMSDDELAEALKSGKEPEPEQEPEEEPDNGPQDGSDEDEPNVGSIDNEDEEPTEEPEGEPEGKPEDENTEQPEETKGEQSEDGKTEEPKGEEDSEPADEKEPAFELKPVKIAGVEYPVNSIDELYALASQGGRFTQKMQTIKPYTKSVEIIKENDLTPEDLALIADVKKGSKDAIAKLLKEANVDPMDIDEDVMEQEYVPKTPIPNDEEMKLIEVVNEISSDPEFQTTRQVVDEQWDEASREVLQKNPELILGLHEDVRTGVFAQVYPEAKKLAILDGYKHSDIEYYVQAGQLVQSQQANQQQPEQSQQPKQENETIRKKRKAASVPKGASSKKPDVIDYMSMSDDEFEKMREEILNRA